jgi:hypothetical protein
MAQFNSNQWPDAGKIKTARFPGIWSGKYECALEINFDCVSLPEQSSIDENPQGNQAKWKTVSNRHQFHEPFRRFGAS